MRKSLSLVLVIGFALCFTPPRVQAISISLEPLAQTVVLGNPVNVAVRIADLGTPGAPPALSTFDLDISFDPGLLAFSQATFGDPVLGNQLDVLGLGDNLRGCDPWCWCGQSLRILLRSSRGSHGTTSLQFYPGDPHLWHHRIGGEFARPHSECPGR